MRRLILSVAFAACLVIAPAASARVLLVGSYHGIRGQFTSIQAAVNAAKPNDWILIGPGDYKTSSVRAPNGAPTVPAGVLITKAGLYLRGMNRNRVIVDGTKPGSAPCSKSQSAQNFGPRSKKGSLGAERDHGLEGRRRVGAEPDDVQLPQRRRRHGQRGLVERRADSGKITGHGLPGFLPERHQHLLCQAQRSTRARPGTGSSRATGTAARGPRITPATSTTRATTSARASSSATRPSTTCGRSSAHSATRARTPAASW